MEEKILIGFAEESITTDKSISLAGQFYERISEYVETPLTVTAMAVKTESEQMVILSTDMVSIADSLLDSVREELKGVEGLDPQKVMINATHTHTSYLYKRSNHISKIPTKNILEKYAPGKKYVSKTSGKNPGMGPDEAAEFLTVQMAKAVKRAWESLHPAQFQFGFGRAAVGMCRRAVYDDGSAKMWGDTALANFDELESGNDSGIEIGFIFDESKKLEGVMANVACPSQILEHRSFVSSDYWGKVRNILRERFGEDLYVVAMCSAAGDMCPRDLIRWIEPETPVDDPNINHEISLDRQADPSMFDIKGTWKAGRRIAREIIDAYEELPETGIMKNEAVFKHEVINLDLPFRRVTLEEYENAIKAIKEFVSECEGDTFNYEATAKMYVHAGTVARYEEQQTIDLVPVEIHVIRFGDIAIATNPFEYFLNYGNKIRARSLAKQTFLIQLCCGSYGYLPTEKAEQGSHYSAYVSSGYVGHEGGELIVRKTLETIRKMFE